MIPNPHLFFQQHNYFNDIQGSVVELGFGQGVSADYFLRLIDEGKLNTDSVWLYDSFEGFPEPTEIDKQSKRNPKKGDWKTLSDYNNALQLQSKYSHIDVKVIKGFVEDTLPTVKPIKIKFLHLDVDIYPGYKAGLDYLYDLVEPGGGIVFDEYDETSDDGTLRWPGAKLAIDTFLESRNRLQDLVAYERNKAYIIK